jgi:CubicO group peptidase (beta-lactamase class C family)
MPPSSPRLDQARLDRAFALVRRQTAEGRASYATLAVGRGGGVLRSETYRDGERVEAPRSAIASITKPITATAVLQLAEEGSLVLTEPIATYIPEFQPLPPAGATAGPEPITAWHVLSHTAGLTDAEDDFLLAGHTTPAAQLERLCRSRLRFPPGSAYAYTSDSFYLLSSIIERQSGMSYPEHLRRRIFEPLGMTATTFDPAEPGPVGLGLEGSIGPPGVPSDLRHAGFIALAMPGGGLWSTADDILRFGRAVLLGGSLDGARVLGRPFVELMTREQTGRVVELGTGRPPTYALGWGRPGLGRGSPASSSAFGHTGATGSNLIVDPANDLVIVYLRNVWGAPMTTADEAVQAVYGALD